MSTQGPWHVDGLKVVAHAKGVVAECPTPRNGGCFECNDNAALIAKAWLIPELEAVLRFYAASDQYGPDGRIAERRPGKRASDILMKLSAQ